MVSKILHKLTGRQHHFKVLVKYTPDYREGGNNITALRTIWMPDRSTILDEREIKKGIGPELIAKIPRSLLKNGKIELCEFYYLGWLKPTRTN